MHGLALAPNPSFWLTTSAAVDDNIFLDSIDNQTNSIYYTRIIKYINLNSLSCEGAQWQPMTTLTKIATDVARKPIQRATAQQPFTFLGDLQLWSSPKTPPQNQPNQPMNAPKNITGISIIAVTIDWVFTANSPMSFSRKWHTYIGTFGRQKTTY